MKLDSCTHADVKPNYCNCSVGCSCRATACKIDDVGYDISDLDMKAVIREKTSKFSTTKFPPIKSTELAACQRCGKSSKDVIWECICQDCQSWPLSEMFQILVRIYNHHGIVNWLHQNKPALNYRTPAQAIDRGDIKEVLKLLKESAI